MKADDTPKLVFLNKNRNGGFAAGLTPEGRPAVLLGDQPGQQRIALGVKDDSIADRRADRPEGADPDGARGRPLGQAQADGLRRRGQGRLARVPPN